VSGFIVPGTVPIRLREQLDEAPTSGVFLSCAQGLGYSVEANGIPVFCGEGLRAGPTLGVLERRVNAGAQDHSLELSVMSDEVSVGKAGEALPDRCFPLV
jgi:hypothetical protein